MLVFVLERHTTAEVKTLTLIDYVVFRKLPDAKKRLEQIYVNRPKGFDPEFQSGSMELTLEGSKYRIREVFTS